ncbi:MAG: hypothetical protein RR973_07885, partial [Anaerovoracaceae bacterium]
QLMRSYFIGHFTTFLKSKLGAFWRVFEREAWRVLASFSARSLVLLGSEAGQEAGRILASFSARSLAHLGSEAGQEVIEKRCANSPKLAMKSVKTR